MISVVNSVHSGERPFGDRLCMSSVAPAISERSLLMTSVKLAGPMRIATRIKLKTWDRIPATKVQSRPAITSRARPPLGKGSFFLGLSTSHSSSIDTGNEIMTPMLSPPALTVYCRFTN